MLPFNFRLYLDLKLPNKLFSQSILNNNLTLVPQVWTQMRLLISICFRQQDEESNIEELQSSIAQQNEAINALEQVRLFWKKKKLELESP